MFRMTSFVFTLLLPGLCLAQVPPGEPYDPAKHPNPILTYVTNANFSMSTYGDATDISGIDLMGLAQSEATRESIQLARGAMRRTRIGPFSVEITYYPVVRQTFKLVDGGDFVLHSFKFPRTGLPPNDARILLNQAAVEQKKDPREMRFGGVTAPEELDIRGREALLFEKDGVITVYWVEAGVGHTVTAKLPRRELFRLIEDLL